MSKQKERPFKILIVDDDRSYVESLHRDAQELRLILRHVTNLDAAKEVLESGEGPGICGAILDVVCMKAKGQEIPDPDFLMPAVDYFRSKAPHLQLVILTGEPDRCRDLKGYFKDMLPVYSKGRDEEAMLTLLKDKAQDIPREKVIRKFLDVFETVEQYLGYEAEERLLACLGNMDKSDPSVVTGTLGNLRKLQEHFYLALNKIDNVMVPDSLVFSDGTRIDNRKIIDYLKGNYDRIAGRCLSAEYVKHNSKEDRLLNLVYRGCSEEIHITEQNTTKYMVQSLVFAFLDLILWLRKIADSKRVTE
jgi:hypothetical protein